MSGKRGSLGGAQISSETRWKRARKKWQHAVGRWVEGIMKAAAAEQDGDAEVVEAAEIKCALLDHLDRRVERLAGGVGDPMREVGQHSRQMSSDHGGDLLDGLEPRVRRQKCQRLYKASP